MKILYKSLLSIVLILSMCIGTVGAAGLTTNDLSEMEFTTDLYTGVSMLMGLGILKDTDTFPANLGEGISRAHFLEFVMRFAMDGTYGTNTADLPFTDVSKSASYYGELAAAVGQGVIMESTHFRPYDYITYEEALTVVFRVYDIDAIVDTTLPWPQNYVSLATKLKLYKGGIRLDHDGFLTYEGFFKLMKDILTANVVEAHYSTAGIEYTISDRKYHEIFYDVYEIEGTVEANGITNISSAGAYKENYLMIDGEYYYSGSNYQSFLGYDVEGFYKEDDLKTIISLSKRHCKEVVIAAKDIEGVSLSGSTVNIKYKEDGKNKDVQIPTSAAVIYNGKSFADDRFYIEWYNISCGSITLLAKNGSAYDTAFIDEYESYIVTGVDTEDDGIIYVKDSESVILENTEEYTITKDGRKIALADIVPDNVISLKKAYDNSRLEIIVSDGKFTSPLTSVDSAGRILYFGAKAYEATSDAFVASLSLGITYDVYVDSFGYIVDCVNVAEDDISVGYIIAASYEPWPKNTVYVAMLKKGDKEPFQYELADKVKIDGKMHRRKQIIENAANNPSSCAFFAGSTEPQAVVIYKFNSEGKLSYIDTKAVGQDEDPKTTLCHKIENKSLYLKNKKFGTAGDKNGAQIAVNTNTMYINVPTVTVDGNKVPSSNYDDYKTVGSMGDKKTVNNLNLYTLGTDGIVAIAGVVYDSTDGGDGTIDDYSQLYVVARISFALKDDEYVRRITVVRNGAETQLYVNPEDEDTYDTDATKKTWINTARNLHIGDAVSFDTDTDGYMNNLKKFFDYQTMLIASSEGFNKELTIGGGYIEHYEGGYYGVVGCREAGDIDTSKVEVLAKGSGGYIYDVLDRELVCEPMSDEKIIRYSSAGKGATIYISKLGYEVNRSFLYYKGQAGDSDKYGDLRAKFYERQGAASYSTIFADATGAITLPANPFTNVGNEFMGWSDGRDVFAAGSTYQLTNYNVSFYPVWATSYKHSFVSDSANATGTAPSDIWEIEGETITLPENTFTNIGWEFIGWTDGTQTYQPGAQYLVTANHVEFKATWQQARSATFAAPSADYTGTAPVAISKIAGSTITLPDNTFSRAVSVGEYVFTGWKLGSATYQAGDSFTMPDNNVEFVAQFKYVGGTANVSAAANVRVQKAMNALGVYEYTSPTTGHLWHRTNLGNNSSNGDAMYRAIKLDLKQFRGIATDNISSVNLKLEASKIDVNCSIYVYRCDGIWNGTDFSTESIPAIGDKIADCGLTNKTLSRTINLTSYIKSKIQSGADYAIVFVTTGNSSTKRENFNGGFRYSSASFEITTTNEQ